MRDRPIGSELRVPLLVSAASAASSPLGSSCLLLLFADGRFQEVLVTSDFLQDARGFNFLLEASEGLLDMLPLFQHYFGHARLTSSQQSPAGFGASQPDGWRIIRIASEKASLIGKKTGGFEPRGANGARYLRAVPVTRTTSSAVVTPWLRRCTACSLKVRMPRSRASCRRASSAIPPAM